MKILHAAETTKGGVGTIIDTLAHHHVLQYGDLNVMCLIPESHSDQFINTPNTCLIPFFRQRRSIRGCATFAVKLILTIRTFKPDIVHFHSTFAGVIGRVLLSFVAKRRRPVIIYTPHGWSFLMLTKPLKNRFYILTEQLLLRVTDAVTLLSRHELTQARQYNFDKKKLTVIHNGTPPVPARGYSDPYPTASTELRVVFLGRFDKAKGFDILLTAISTIPRSAVHLWAIGAPVESPDTPPSLPNVTYTGWLSRAQLIPYLRYGDVLVAPSRWEGFGLAAIEAMACGLPVIASNCAAYPEIVEHGQTGFLFDPLHPEEIARYLLETTRPQWKAMGLNGIARHRQFFTSEQMLRKFDLLYSSTCAN